MRKIGFILVFPEFWENPWIHRRRRYGSGGQTVRDGFPSSSTSECFGGESPPIYHRHMGGSVVLKVSKHRLADGRVVMQVVVPMEDRKISTRSTRA